MPLTSFVSGHSLKTKTFIFCKFKLLKSEIFPWWNQGNKASIDWGSITRTLLGPIPAVARNEILWLRPLLCQCTVQKVKGWRKNNFNWADSDKNKLYVVTGDEGSFIGCRWQHQNDTINRCTWSLRCFRWMGPLETKNKDISPKKPKPRCQQQFSRTKQNLSASEQ